jgi:LCP family protein required for cell wall assembly
MAAATVPHGRHRRPAPRKKWVTVLLGVTGSLAAVVGVAIGAVTWTANDAGSQVDRLPDALPSENRPPAAPETTTFLVVGVDGSTGADDGAVAESVMLVRVPADRHRVQVVYLPPGLSGEDGIGSHARVGGLLEPGGTVPLVEAVESLTEVRVDHVALVDFPGFQAMTDAVGGVTVDVPKPYSNRGQSFAAGEQRLDGAAALAYVRSSGAEARAGAGDRQRQMIQALFERVSEQGALSDLGRLTDTVQSLTRSVKVDDALDNAGLVALAWELRATGSPVFMTAPTDGRAELLWEYLRSDSLQDHLDEFR